MRREPNPDAHADIRQSDTYAHIDADAPTKPYRHGYPNNESYHTHVDADALSAVSDAYFHGGATITDTDTDAAADEHTHQFALTIRHDSHGRYTKPTRLIDWGRQSIVCPTCGAEFTFYISLYQQYSLC